MKEKSQHEKSTSGHEPLPDWLTHTPDETIYSLTMFDGGGTAVQDIEITRDEYLALKAHLANLRGYVERSVGAAAT